MEKIRVAIFDDHKLMTDCLENYLKYSDNIEVCGVGHSGSDAIAMAGKLELDVIVLDINMPKPDGIETTKLLKGQFPKLKILILSMYLDYERISGAIDAGADGYVPKDLAAEELIEAIQAIYMGKNYFHNRVTDEILVNLSQKKKKVASEIPTLSKRELEVLTLFAQGLNNNEIADKLFLSIRTVESHKNHILQKTNLKNSVELIKFAIKNKLIEI